MEIDGKKLLKGIDLHLEPGDVYGFLGPNGAGKTTTMYALLGLRERSGGTVRVLGHDPAFDALEIRRQIGVMPESAGFYDWMSATAYLQWFGGLYGYSLGYSDIREILWKVGLGSDRQGLIGTYSRGMKQRLAIARALLPKPKILLLDEPTNGLDPQGRREFHDLLADFAADHKTAVLLCTHLLDDVDRLCNRIGIIDHGRTRFEGRLGELLAERNTEQRYRVRLEGKPDTTDLPVGLDCAALHGNWCRLQLVPGTVGSPSDLWAELWRRGWRIIEIHPETLSLEELYLETIEASNDREAA